MNFIDNIEIKNFKSIHDAKIIECKRVNVFVGPPNVGKSNILEGLGLLTFIRQKRPNGLKGLLRFERFTQMFNLANIKEPIIISFNNKYTLAIKYEDENGIEFYLVDNEGSDYVYNSGRLGMRVGAEVIRNISSTDNIDDFSGRINELINFNVLPYKFSDSKIFNKSISALQLNVPFGENMFEVIVNDDNGLKKEFSDLLKPNNMDLIIDDSTNEIRIYSQIKEGVIHSLPMSLLADTLIRLMFFKTAVYSNKKSVLLFEEPEANCYEPYIMEITNAIKNDKNGNQFFIVTHSQYVIDELMRDEESRNDTNIYLVGLDNNETKVKLLSAEASKEAYQTGLNLFFNYQTLWDEN